MRQLRTFGAGLALLVAVAGAGCGGGGGGGGTASAEGAAAAPAGSAAFISINSDATSDQWKQVNKLLKKFPGRAQVMNGFRKSLREQGVDYEKDVKPAIGDEVDVVWLDFQNGGDDFVALTQPKNDKKFKQLLAKSDEKIYSEEVGDWTAFGPSQSALATYRQRAKGKKLSGDETFKDAMGEVNGAALVKIYVSGQSIAGAFQSLASAGGGGGAPLGLDQLDFVAAQAQSQEDGLRVEGAVKSNDGRPLGTSGTFKSKLISGVPSGALALLDFRGDGVQEQLTELRNRVPEFNRGVQEFERSLGVRLESVLGLLGHENALYVRQGAPIPEISLALEAPNLQQAMATVDRLAARIAQLAHGRLTSADEDGVTVKTLTFPNFAVHYAGFDGRILITNGPTGIRDYRAGGDKLTGDSVFKDATDAAGMPDQTSGLVYVNLKDAIPLVENFATTAGESIPPQVADNLRPLRSFVAYGSGDKNLSKFTAFLQIK